MDHMDSVNRAEQSVLFRPNPFDWALILILGILGMYLLTSPWNAGKPVILQVITGDNMIEYRLREGLGQTLEVQGEIGKSIIRAGRSGCRFISSPCGDKICVGWGTLGFAGNTAVCAPNRVAIRLVTEERAFRNTREKGFSSETDNGSSLKKALKSGSNDRTGEVGYDLDGVTY
ncbi:MAG: hypothetical protein CVV64_09110 [Candidatus Wallbacteria bacterium HGW-Wallbacteria-1]|jgi:hypothetical protein|uniref:Uncharacterized protein n=1 Tax=Candidatus Wallbacteria bacterium HGW-Wallbacteria-1 TaxID=2013854 RepID=A0A2N1PQE1_9BACT|nr:MAG: hypothetical protein CVV64_09110 [Candidatus Wallbacteria bacterium HGW-Wallbacteria-1]